MRRALSTLFWAFLTVTSVMLFFVAVLIWVTTVAFDRRLAVLHRFTCFWASLYSWTNPAWPVRIEGRERIEQGKAYVMVANHLSLLDILVLFRLHTHFKWVSKVENFNIPFIGWNMRMNRYIEIRRGDRSSVVQMMREARAALEGGSSIMMFPEGTRSLGRLKSFKPGAFELAKDTASPLLPIVIQGTAEALPKRGFVLQGRHPITITILEPIPPERFRDLSVEALTERVRDRIADQLGEKTEITAAG